MKKIITVNTVSDSNLFSGTIQQGDIISGCFWYSKQLLKLAKERVVLFEDSKQGLKAKLIFEQLKNETQTKTNAMIVNDYMNSGIYQCFPRVNGELLDNVYLNDNQLYALHLLGSLEFSRFEGSQVAKELFNEFLKGLQNA